jgi:uncharacterized membrane protein YbaN (DUF454 family)
MRQLYLILGFLFLGLAFLGAILPVLPTTPFALLASAMFLRSSPRLNRWMLRNRLLGPLLRDWQRHRGVRPHVKVTAVVTIIVVGGLSLCFLDVDWPIRLLVLALLLIGLTVVLRLRVVRDGEPPDRDGA